MFYFECSIEDCPTTYRRKDHLARHFLQHKGKIFSYSVDGCNKSFAYQGNMKKHVNEIHNDELASTPGECKSLKQHVFPEVGCGKVFKFKNSADSEAFRCDVEGCLCIFSTKSNLRQPVKAVHLEVRPFVCSYKDCGKKFAYRHVRDHHEKTSCHVYTLGDFEELDEQFPSRPRGGRKRKCPTIESLLRKRVTLPNELDFLLD
ncbi:hypothetical protein ACJRO7_000903 [Eucalyptus globulus]|uniref:C2H2-type domain-containing protein n=1 Tax=Eucalyptus globulus TaxID=34317 RepID=A0ABD3LQD4_EUCGL